MRAQPPRAPRPAGAPAPSTPSSRSRRPPRRRWRLHERCCVASGSGSARATTRTRSLSAERGYLRETGNLVFHLALIVVIIGVAIGHLFGWRGDVIVPVGQRSPTRSPRYDTFSPGPWVDTGGPLAVLAHRRQARRHLRGAGHRARPVRPAQGLHGARHDDGHARRHADARRRIKVNHPLEIGRRLRLPARQRLRPRHHRARRQAGTVIYRDATPFLAQDNNYKSVGAIKVTGATPKQLGFFGLFLPTAVISKETGPSSIFPDAKNPGPGPRPVRGGALPRGAAAVGVHPRHQAADPDQERQGHRRAAHLARAGPDLPAPRRAGAASPSTASSASPACRSAPTPARDSPWPARCWPWPGSSPAW